MIEAKPPGVRGRQVDVSCTMVVAARLGFGDAQVVVPVYSSKAYQFVGTVVDGTVVEHTVLCDTPFTVEHELAVQVPKVRELFVPMTAPVQVVPEKKVVTAHC